LRLRGRKLWLIGGSSGIGAALAPRLAAEGAVLALSARRVEELQKVADAAALRGERPLVMPLDVGDLDAIARVYEELKSDWGQVDIVFYNVGTWAQANVETFDTEQAVKQIDVNFLGLVRTAGTVLPDFIAHRGGQIVGMASLAGYAGLPGASAYSSSKAGVNAFLQALRVELKHYNVGVTTINPGFVRTPLTDRNDFKMPFLLEADDAAGQIVEGLLDGQAEIHFPRRLSWPLKVFTALPRSLYEPIARNLFVRRTETPAK
jgi:short-subunit dehydrogenase